MSPTKAYVSFAKQRHGKRKTDMLFSEDVKSRLDVVDDEIIMVHRLKVLEHLLLKCCNGLPSVRSRFSDETRGGYDSSEMMHFVDESLACLIQEYEGQITKCDNMRAPNNASKIINTFEDKKL